MESIMWPSLSNGFDLTDGDARKDVAGRGGDGELRVAAGQRECRHLTRRRAGGGLDVDGLAEQSDRLVDRLQAEQLLQVLVQPLRRVERRELRNLRHEVLVLHRL